MVSNSATDAVILHHLPLLFLQSILPALLGSHFPLISVFQKLSICLCIYISLGLKASLSTWTALHSPLPWEIRPANTVVHFAGHMSTQTFG